MLSRTQNGRRGYCEKYLGTADPVGMDRKSCLYTLYWNIMYWRDFFPIYRLDQLYRYVIGAIFSSSILCPILFTTYYSMTFVYEKTSTYVESWTICDDF